MSSATSSDSAEPAISFVLGPAGPGGVSHEFAHFSFEASPCQRTDVQKY